MSLLPKQRIEIASGRYLLRHSEHYNHIQVMIEEEVPNSYEPISLTMSETILPGSDQYVILFKRKETKQEKKIGQFQQEINKQP